MSTKLSAEEFIQLQGYPVFDKFKNFIKCSNVNYIRYWTTETVTTAEVHIHHQEVAHVTIGTGKRYSDRIRVAVRLKTLGTFERKFGKLEKDNSMTYVKYDAEGFAMLQLIAKDWESSKKESYFAYHGPQNSENFDFNNGYGFSSHTKFKYDNINLGDIVYVIQKLKHKKVFELCGKYEVKDKRLDSKNNLKRKYRLVLSDISNLTHPILIDEDFWGKSIPQVKSNNGWSNFKENFCQQKDNLAKKLCKKTISIFDYFLNEDIDDEEEDIDDEEDELDAIDAINSDSTITTTERDLLIKARRGQGIFRKNVIAVEQQCRVTDVTFKKHLIASHIKPWKLSNNMERLDGNNGLLLSPHIDHLFDKGYITFQDCGDLVLSSHLSRELPELWNIEKKNYGSFNTKQKVYLEFHRNKVFEKFLQS